MDSLGGKVASSFVKGLTDVRLNLLVHVHREVGENISWTLKLSLRVVKVECACSVAQDLI